MINELFKNISKQYKIYIQYQIFKLREIFFMLQSNVAKWHFMYFHDPCRG